MNAVKVTTTGQISIPTEIRRKYKYAMDDFKKFSFKGKNPKEKSLSRKVDEIVYLEG